MAINTTQEWKIDKRGALYCLPEIPDNSVDLIVTSPPYDNIRDYEGFEFNFELISSELYRVMKEGGVIIWIVGDETIDGSETGTSFKQALRFKEIGFKLKDTMIYRKLNGAMGSKYTYLQEFEYMFVLSKGNPKTVNFLRDRKNVRQGSESTIVRKSDSAGTLRIRKNLIRTEFGRRKNIWDYAVGGEQNGIYHPAIFPYKLAEDHIKSWSNEGDLILDPFLGSGTTLEACVNLNRNCIGFEITNKWERNYRAIMDKKKNMYQLSKIFKMKC